MSFQIVNSDITRLAVDAIVNPTDSVYSGSGGTDLAVHTAAGIGLRQECYELPELQTGAVSATKGFGLPCRFIIHTVGPVWRDGKHNEPILLRSCYLNALLMARKLGASSVAFPLISAGTFHFPKDQVLEIVISAIRDFFDVLDGEMQVILCIYDREAYEISRKYELEKFLHSGEAAKHSDSEPGCCDLPTWLKNRNDSFAVTLMKLIDQKGMTDVECYKKAQVHRNTFWKIRNSPTYVPGKLTVLQFAIALHLTLEETMQFLNTVGFSLSHSNISDMIFEFYISHGIYDIFEINAALFRYGQKCMAAIDVTE